MPIQSALEKLQRAPAAAVHVLEPAKAARMKAKTMFIPAPSDVAKVIASIPSGETRSMLEVRRALAELGNAEIACPAVTTKYWKWLALAEAELAGQTSIYAVPWWRVLKEGNSIQTLPGGAAGQRTRLERERAECANG